MAGKNCYLCPLSTNEELVEYSHAPEPCTPTQKLLSDLCLLRWGVMEVDYLEETATVSKQSPFTPPPLPSMQVRQDLVDVTSSNYSTG